MEDEEKMKVMFEKAVILASQVHQGQRDKLGKPYILHPIAVASLVNDFELKTIAMLHDTIEDTWVTAEYLLNYGFTKEIVEAVEGVTNPKDGDYEAYLRKVKSNPKSRLVKLADLAHNTSPEREAGLNDARRKRYTFAKKFLNE